MKIILFEKTTILPNMPIRQKYFPIKQAAYTKQAT